MARERRPLLNDKCRDEYFNKKKFSAIPPLSNPSSATFANVPFLLNKKK